MKLPTTTCLLLLAAIAGCSAGSDDARLVELAREASDRQADQNREIAEQNQQLAEATKQLLEADAAARKHLIEAEGKSRQEFLALQQGLQAERTVVGQERDALEDERRKIAQDRKWDSILAQVLSQAGLALACLAPLAVGCYLLYGLRGDDRDEAIGELLAQELVSDSPLLLPPRPIHPAGLPAPSAPPPDASDSDPSSSDESPAL